MDIIKNLKHLPKISSVTTQLMELMNQDNSDINSMGELIALDPQLTLLVLKLVNSAHYSPNTPVTDVSRAVKLLGFKTICFIIMGASTVKTINSFVDNDIINKNEFWIHSFKCAIASRFLASLCNYPDPFEGYLVGMFHDLGKVILANNFSEEYEKILKASKNDSQVADLETEYWGYSHADVSALLVLDWKLNNELAEVISVHHTEELLNDVSKSDLAYLLYFSNKICHLQSEVFFNDEELYASFGEELHAFLLARFSISNYDQFSEIIVNPTIDHLDENEYFYQNLLNQ